jgi:methionyl-tRNA synthetase
VREIMGLTDRANLYIDQQKPWLMAKDPARAGEVQAVCTQGLNLFRVLALYLKPVMPRLAGRLLIAHGAGDESIPYTESLRLASAAGPREEAIILESFHHVGPRPWWPSLAHLRDGGRLVRIAEGLLSP